MKKILVFVLAISLIFTLAGCGSTRKEKILNLVEKKYDAIVTACQQKDEQALLKIRGVTRVSITDGYVVVFCESAGISVSSQDYGFYYSEENIPVGVDCNQYLVRAKLSPEGNGYQCVVDGNIFYTEHIKGNIYFYSNAY